MSSSASTCSTASSRGGPAGRRARPGRLVGTAAAALGLVLLVVSVGQAAERTTVTRHSLRELRDRYVVKQRLDYSCGAAALATLIRYYFGEPTSEAEILRLMAARLSPEELRLRETRGFSLLDLKRAAAALGYQAAGFKVTVEDLARLAAPVIVFVQPLDYQHFAVLRGVSGGRVFLADPARGNVRMTVGRFQGEWGGIVFVLGKPGEADIHAHSLSLPRDDDLDPPLGAVAPLWESGGAGLALARRARPR
jgi:uncharacterized protein